jgi:hypothetical protein
MGIKLGCCIIIEALEGLDFFGEGGMILTNLGGLRLA